MNLHTYSSTRATRRQRNIRTTTAFLALLGLVAGAKGQGTASPGTVPDYTGAERDAQLSSTNAPPLAPVDFTAIAPVPPPSGTRQLAAMPAPVGPPPVPLLQLGPVRFQPHLFYRLSYGDGIQSRPGQDNKTWINEISPGMLLRLGDHWALDYTPTLSYYSSSHFRDTLEHAVSLSGGTTYRDWTFGLTQTYSATEQPLVETGTQTAEEDYFTGLSAIYQISEPLSLELAANQYFRFVDQSTAYQLVSDSRTWSTLDWLNYQFNPKLAAAIGVGFAYDDVTVGSDMTSEQLQGRITWKASEKFNLSANGGFEDRQFLDSGVSDKISPIFGLTAAYTPFETTTLSLNASHRVTPSYYGGQVTEDTTVSAGLSQRLLGKLTLSLSGGYGNTSYEATTLGPESANVTDYDRTFFNARLSSPFLKRGTVAVFYQTNLNSSDSYLYDYSSTQVGLELGYRF